MLDTTTATPPRQSRTAARSKHRPALPPGWRGIVAGAVLIFGMAIALTLFASVIERWWYRGRALPGVRVENVSLSGADERAIAARLQPITTIIETSPVTATGTPQQLVVSPATVDARVDVDATVRAARRAGRSTNPVTAITDVVLRRFRPARVPVRATVSDDKIRAVVSGWLDQASNGRADAKVTVVGTQVQVTPPRSGVGISSGPARADLRAALLRADRRTIQLKTGASEPDISLEAANAAAESARAILGQPLTLTVNGTALVLPPEKVGSAIAFTPRGSTLVASLDPVKLRALFGPAVTQLERAPVNAGWNTNGASVNVVPAQMGLQIDFAAVCDAVVTGTHQVTGTLKEVAPERTTEWAQTMNITKMVATFTTNHPAGQERVKNIHRAADVVNNTLVEPGVTFSLNEKLGRRTAESGYVSAPVYVQGEFQEDFGGGVSQFTTTLYNATFFGGYKDVTHAPHSIYISRYPMGREATLNFGSIDLKFQNDTASGLLIRTVYTSTSITVTLYGNNEDRSVKAEGPNILERVEAETEFVDDPALPIGAQKELQPGYPRIVVENFRTITQPGKPDRRERYVWTYESVKRKVARGPIAPTPSTPAAAAASPTATTTTTRPR
ncbi:MAG: VanW family protein [Acidimicrobiia bacterium]